jgi:hypothetical protein
MMGMDLTQVEKGIEPCTINTAGKKENTQFIIE